MKIFAFHYNNLTRHNFLQIFRSVKFWSFFWKCKTYGKQSGGTRSAFPSGPGRPAGPGSTLIRAGPLPLPAPEAGRRPPVYHNGLQSVKKFSNRAAKLKISFAFTEKQCYTEGSEHRGHASEYGSRTLCFAFFANIAVSFQESAARTGTPPAAAGRRSACRRTPRPENQNTEREAS